MKRGKPALIPAALAGLVVLALLLGFWVSNLRRPQPEGLVLPPSPSIYSPVSGGVFFPSASEIPAEILGVSPDTVQQVLKTITRPANYSAKYSTTWHFDSEQRSSYSNVYALGGEVKIETFDTYGQPDMHYLTDGETISFWEDGSPVLTAVSMGERNTDDPARIPTYESIFALDKADILSASYEKYGGRPFVAVTTRGPVYDTKWWISLETALMHRAELTERDGSPAVTVEMAEYLPGPPERELFKSP